MVKYPNMFSLRLYWINLETGFIIFLWPNIICLNRGLFAFTAAVQASPVCCWLVTISYKGTAAAKGNAEISISGYMWELTCCCYVWWDISAIKTAVSWGAILDGACHVFKKSSFIPVVFGLKFLLVIQAKISTVCIFVYHPTQNLNLSYPAS